MQQLLDDGASRAEDASAPQPFFSRDLLDLPHHGVWILDAHGRTVFANDTLRQLLGGGEIEGRRVNDFVPEGERGRVEAHATRRAFGVADEYETRLRGSDGFEIPVLISASPRFDEEGAYRGTVALVRDLRVERQVDAALAERMGREFVRGHEQQLGRCLTTGFAHALNSSLQALVGHAEALGRAGDLPEDLRATADKMQGAARTCTRLVGHLLSLGHVGDERPTRVDVAALVEEALTNREAYLPANNIAVSRSYAGDTPPVQAEPGRIQRAVAHLVDNACEIALVGGGGSLAVDVGGRDGRVRLVLQLTGHRYPEQLVDLTLSALRPGLSPMALSHAVASGIVADLGGTVRVRNGERGGELELDLPAAPGSSRPKRRRGVIGRIRRTPPQGHARARILIIDDDDDILEINESALAGLGDLVTARNADEALDLLRDRDFDLIVSDLRMPGALDGFGLHQWLAATRPELVERLLFTTADTTSTQAREFLVSSGRPCVQKPYAVRDLRAVVAEILGLPE